MRSRRWTLSTPRIAEQGYEEQDGVGGISTAPAVGATFLRGTQLADADGWVRFKTVYPSWYGGRTPHIHFKVLIGAKEVVASRTAMAASMESFAGSSAMIAGAS